MRRRRMSYKFTEKTHSKKAMISIGLAAVTIVMYFVFIFLSYRSAGQLSPYYGAVGVLAMLVACVSLGMSIDALKEEDSFTLFPRISIGVSIVSTLLWVGNYILGFMRG